MCGVRCLLCFVGCCGGLCLFVLSVVCQMVFVMCCWLMAVVVAGVVAGCNCCG